MCFWSVLDRDPARQFLPLGPGSRTWTCYTCLTTHVNVLIVTLAYWFLVLQRLPWDKVNNVYGFGADECCARSQRRLTYYQQKIELDSLHRLRQFGSSAEEKRTGQQHLQALADKLLSLRDTADGTVISFLTFSLQKSSAKCSKAPDWRKHCFQTLRQGETN